MLVLLQLLVVVEPLTHWLLCDELENWPMNWLRLNALALDAVMSGDAIIANAAAIAANAKMDFVFIVSGVCMHKEKYKPRFAINTQNGTILFLEYTTLLCLGKVFIENFCFFVTIL